MPTLFTLHLSRHVRGMVKGPVKARPSVTSYGGLWREAEQDFMRPDYDAIRECLPAQYRKAYFRSGMRFWFPKEGAGPAHLALYGSRGQYLNTIYAQPVDFPVDTAALTA